MKRAMSVLRTVGQQYRQVCDLLVNKVLKISSMFKYAKMQKSRLARNPLVVEFLKFLVFSSVKFVIKSRPYHE